jgi:hypothetical protein
MPPTERDAHLARELFSGELVKNGAHAIGVEPGTAHGHDGFVVVAYVPPAFSGRLPAALDIPAERGGVKVPLVTRRQERFKPE